jgi:hypothetical protein
VLSHRSRASPPCVVVTCAPPGATWRRPSPRPACLEHASACSGRKRRPQLGRRAFRRRVVPVSGEDASGLPKARGAGLGGGSPPSSPSRSLSSHRTVSISSKAASPGASRGGEWGSFQEGRRGACLRLGGRANAYKSPTHRAGGVEPRRRVLSF